jgi:hypothetical protein
MSWTISIIFLLLWLPIVGLILWDARDPPIAVSNHHERALVNWTRVLAISTCLLFAATGYSAFVLNTTDHTLKETLEASNRAWIAPHLLQLMQPIKAGEKTDVLLYFGNIGREPAINVGNHIEGKSLPIDNFIGGPSISPPQPRSDTPSRRRLVRLERPLRRHHKD